MTNEPTMTAPETPKPDGREIETFLQADPSGFWGFVGDNPVVCIPSRVDELESMVAGWPELAALRSIIKADSDRLLVAGLRVDLNFGCDTADHMADEILELRARVAELEAALDKYGEHDDGWRTRCALQNVCGYDPVGPTWTLVEGKETTVKPQCTCGLDAALKGTP